MEGAGDGQQSRVKAPGAGRRCECLNGACGAGNDGLIGRVVIGDDDLAVIGESRLDLLARSEDGRHHALDGSIACFRHRLTAQARKPEEVVARNDAGGVQRRELAIAVAGHHAGLEPKLACEVEEAHADGADRGLRNPRVGELLFLLFGLFGAEGRRRMNIARKKFRQARLQSGVGGLDGFAQGGYVERRLARHVGMLGALPREQKSDFA